MARKPKPGYYVKGQFVHEGSELDLELRRQAKGDTDVSKTDLKRESDALQELGRALLDLRADLLAALPLPDKLREALDAMRRITDFGARRRQLQFIGKLMRQLDADTVAAAQAALQAQKDGSAVELAALRQAEHWRDRLIDADQGDAALTEWMAAHPATDAQQWRALVRQARKDAAARPDAPGAAQRHGRAYRELFQLIKTALANPPMPAAAESSETEGNAADVP